MNSFKKILAQVLLAIVSVFFVSAAASDSVSSDPEALMRVAIGDVLKVLQQHEALYTSNPQQLRDKVEQAALPYFNVTRMAQLALAKHWRTASAAQRDIYLREFKTYLIRSYTKTLYLYRNTQAEIIGRDDKGADKTTVKVRVKNERGEAVILFLRLEQFAGEWKVLDINVEGISLVVTARGVFDDAINKQGLEGFLQDMIAQNKKAAGNEPD